MRQEVQVSDVSKRRHISEVPTLRVLSDITKNKLEKKNMLPSHWIHCMHNHLVIDFGSDQLRRYSSVCLCSSMRIWFCVVMAGR